MKNKKICIFLIGLLALTMLFDSTTAVARINRPVFYISSKGKVCFNKKIGKFGNFTYLKHNGQKYATWSACSIPVKNRFRFTCRNDTVFFTKFLFGKKMNSEKISDLDFYNPYLEGKYKIDIINYFELLKEVWVNLVSKDFDFVLIYKLDDKNKIKQIEFLTD